MNNHKRGLAPTTSAVLFLSLGMVSGGLLVTEPPSDRTVPFAAATSFHVGVSGDGPFFYQWQRNNTNLPKGVIVTVAGTGATGYSGDGGMATNTALTYPAGLVVDAAGNVLIATCHRVLAVSSEGTITTVAGTGSYGYSGDGIAATNSTLRYPHGLALDAVGNLFIADYDNQRIRKVDRSGIITTVAGTGGSGYSGDGIDATSATLDSPCGVAVDARGNLYIADNGNYRIRKVDTNGLITTVAGTGTRGYSGDGGFATNAQVGYVSGIAVDATGNLFYADSYAKYNRVRKIGTNGIITTMAGSGSKGFGGDSGSATNANLNAPTCVAVDRWGNLFIGDNGNHCIRKVSPNGVITTVAGNGIKDFAGDGGLAGDASFKNISSLAVDGSGNLLVGDDSAQRVREISLVSGWPTLALACVTAKEQGAYRVIVGNASGSVTSQVATLTVTLPGTAEGWIAAGNRALVTSDLAAANEAFEAAVALSPNSAEANARACVSRFFLIPRQPAVSNYLATRLQLPHGKFDAYNWVPDVKYNQTNGAVEVIASVEGVLFDLLGAASIAGVTNLNTADAIALFTNHIMPTIMACNTNLLRITDPNYTLVLTTNDTHFTNTVVFDRGDFLLLRAMIQTLSFGEHTAKAHNFEFDLCHLITLYTNDELTLQRLLADYPQFLEKTPAKPAELALSKTAFTNAAKLYFEGSAFIRTNRAPNAVRLLNFYSNLTNYEAAFRDYLGKAVDSLKAPVVFDTTNQYAIYLEGYFGCTNAVRDYLPSFSGNTYLANSIPDYTFHGILQGVPAWKIESFFRDTFGSTPAGIYSTRLVDSSKTVGHFAMFIQTNGEAVVVAALTNWPSSVCAGFGCTDAISPMTELSWETTTNGFRFDLALDKGFGFSAPYLTNVLFGSLEESGYPWRDVDVPDCTPVTGPYDPVAGVYSGTWSSTNLAPNVSGRIEAILVPDGTLCFVQYDSSGKISDSGFCQFASNGTGVAISGNKCWSSNTLNSAACKITGVFVSSGASGTITLKRSAALARDAAPTITSAPVNQTAQPGGKVTFAVKAAGGEPLCYQWYSNSVALKGATTSSLVVSNLTAAANGATYTVKVHNVVGENSASATLRVNAVSDTTLPTVTVKSPAASQSVSNAVLMIQGTASDKGGVAGIWCQLNDDVNWTAATGTTNWSVLAQLTQRTNTLRVYAADLSGNKSKTNVVRFYYVPCVRLTVTVRGNGTLTPNWTNALVASNQWFTLTAKPKAGNAFYNWTDRNGVELSDAGTWSLKLCTDTNIVANFISNPFSLSKGTFAGLYLPDTEVDLANSGYFTATLTDQGAFSAKFSNPLGDASWSGQFSAKGYVSKVITRKGLEPLTVQMWLDMTAGSNIVGRVSGTNWSSVLVANRAMFSKTNRPAMGGKQFTLAIPGAEVPTNQPGGYGYGALTVDATGNISLSGALSDGAVVTEKTFVSPAGDWPVYASLYSGKGVLLGWMSFTNGAVDGLGGVLHWIKLPQTQSKLYPGGFRFTNGIAPLASVYSPTNTPLAGWTNGVISLNDGRPQDLTFTGLNLKGTKGSGSNGLSLTITASSGVFKGSIKPAGWPATTFSGVLLQNRQAGCGSFVRTNVTGGVLLEPAE